MLIHVLIVRCRSSLSVVICCRSNWFVCFLFAMEKNMLSLVLIVSEDFIEIDRLIHSVCPQYYVIGSTFFTAELTVSFSFCKIWGSLT